MSSALQPAGEVGLRERQRARATRRIQQVAVALFDARGFDLVTIEEVAAAADVSPSTVYRYFGTKEGLLIRDEHDNPLFDRVAELLVSHDPWDAVLLGLQEHGPWNFAEDGDLALRRIRYFVEVTSVRKAALLLVDEAAALLAAGILTNRPQDAPDPITAAAIAGSIVFTIWCASRAWYTGGASEPLNEAITRAILALRPCPAG
jgi:AcrR family transcriptional regulator